MDNSVENLKKDIDKKIKELEDNETDTVDKLTDYIDKKIEDFENENKEPTNVEELTSQIDKQIARVVKKEYPEAEYHKMIIIDGTTGQNSLSQVELFDEAVGLTDVTVTKLDGTSKGGFLVALANNFDVQIRYVGVGESAEDLINFDSKEFVDSIIE